MDINGLHEIVKNLREDFNLFKTNDFHALEEKTDGIEKAVSKLSVKIAWIMGGFTVINGLVWVLIKVLG